MKLLLLNLVTFSLFNYTFMISRPIYQGSDWRKFSIWNSVTSFYNITRQQCGRNVQDVIFQIVSGTCLLYSFWPSALIHRIVGVFFIAEKYLVPLFILMYCYGKIIWVLSKRAESNLDTTDSQGDKFQLAKKNTIKTFLIVSVCFVLCWFNAQLAYLLYNLGFNISLAGTYNKVSTVIAFVNCTINPFIYLIKYRDYQVALKSFFSCFFSAHNERNPRRQEVRSSSVVSSEVNTAS